MDSFCGFVVPMIVKDNRVAPRRSGATRCIHLRPSLELDTEDDRDPVRRAVRESLLCIRTHADVPRLDEQASHAPEVEVEAGTRIPAPLPAGVAESLLV